MKRTVTLICILFISLSTYAQTHITGTVKDSQTNEAISFCHVVLLGTTLQTAADMEGKFTLDLADSIVSGNIVVSFLDYKNDTIQLTKDKTDYQILLSAEKEVVKTLDEVVVTGVTKATLIRENPIPIINVSTKAIDKAAESNIIDALVKNVPGLNAVKTGPNISKPFIRGLGYNRVLTLYDGVRQEGQQWGDEHGIEVDAYNIERAEVIKGPASLMYGSDALAGVVSMLPVIPKEKDGKIYGRYLSEYQSNNGLVGNGLRIGYSNKHMFWAVRGNYRFARNYTNRIDGRVYNTGFQEKNLSVVVGYTGEKGYTHLNATVYDNLQGIPDGSRDSLSRKFTRQVGEAETDDIKNRPLVTDTELNSYKLSPLVQHIQHYRIYSNNHYIIGKGDLDANLAFQQNIRREYNHPTTPDQAGMYVRLNTINYTLRYNAPKIQHTDISIGLNGMVQNNKNKNATDFPIPDYSLADIGGYLYAKWKKQRWTLSGGARYDVRLLWGDDFYVKTNTNTGYSEHVGNIAGATLQFPKLNQHFNGISSSLGATYMLSDKISLKANIARGYRAPNITEVAANGLDPGAHIVYQGNRSFVPEFSFQQDLGLSANYKNASGTFAVFNNTIDNYIYLSQLADAQGNPVVIVPGNKTFQYQQASAHLYGTEASLNIHPVVLKGFMFSNSMSVVYGINTKSDYSGKGIYGEYLPFIPPFKWLSSITQDFKIRRKVLAGLNAKVETDYNGAQNRYMALYQTETATAAYVLFNAAVGADINYRTTAPIQLQFQVNNIFDIAYQSNLSRLKYFEYYSQSPNGRFGMYGMGRSICAKVIIPF